MSVYKVPQDVEAEDKLIGPFSFKQMILLLIAAFLGFIMVMLARISIFLIIIPLPFFLVFLFFGIYRRKDQSVETYVAAILRFYFKPRKRIWDKDGILETVIITAPKQVAAIAIDNMNNNEVRNRLKTLGNLMDTRGWSAKNATLQDGTMAMDLAQSDRLVTPMAVQEPTELHDSDDIMDNYNSATAQSIAERTAAMQNQAREAAMQKMQQTPVKPVSSQPQEEREQEKEESKPEPSASVMTTDVAPDILELSRNNDRSVASIAKEADKILESGDTISLHGH